MKKLVSAILTACITLSAIPAFAAKDFSDLPADHWSYAAVQHVAAKGVINGYEDGTFRPNNTVTRAEFVKLIGKGETVRETPFTDVPADHWGYDYIMSSGMEITGDRFLPDQPILRGEVLDLLWARNGKPDVVVSCAISGQWKNIKSVSWAYSTGLMIGDDGINLRLNDTLTRAEAAVLIQRSEGLSAGVNSLKKHVTDEMLLQVLQLSGLMDNATDLNAAVTNIELAKAAVRYEFGEFDPPITRYPVGSVETDDGKVWGYVDMEYLDTRDYGNEKMSAQAAVSDAVAVLMGAAMRAKESDQKFYFSDTGFEGVEATGNKALYLKVAKGIGLEFDGEGALTARDMAWLVFQLDRFVGTKVKYVNDDAENASVQMHASEMPANAAEYPTILEEIPKHVHEAPYAEACVNDYEFARQYSVVFYGMLTRWAQQHSKNGVKIEFTYYPSLTRTTADGRYIMRVKMEVSGDTAGKVLQGNGGMSVPMQNCFLEIATRTPLNTTVYPAEDLVITNMF